MNPDQRNFNKVISCKYINEIKNSKKDIFTLVYLCRDHNIGLTAIYQYIDNKLGGILINTVTVKRT